MPQDGSNNYNYPPGTPGISGETIESEAYNTFLNDLVVNDLNWPRPIHRGGTGASTANQALINLTGEKAKQIVSNFDDHVWMNGSFYSDASASGAPIPTTPFVGIYYANASGNEVIEARVANTAPVGVLFVKQKVAGVWGTWTVADGSDKVARAGDTMTGQLILNYANPSIRLQKQLPGETCQLAGGLLDKARWLLSLGDNALEAGSNTGSDFILHRYDDGGTVATSAMQIKRNDGQVNFNGPSVNVGVGQSGTAIGQVSINGGVGASSGALLAFRRDGAGSFLLGHSESVGIGTGNNFSLYNSHASAKAFEVDAGLNRIVVAGDPVVALGVATKQYADGHGFTTGDVKFTIKTSADPGWVMFAENMNIGGPSSGAAYPAADAQPLFTLLFNTIADPWAPIYDLLAITTRASQGSAAAAWANNCKIQMPRTLGRALAVAGAGPGLTPRSLGEYTGVQSITQTTGTMAGHGHNSSTGGSFFTQTAGLNNYDPFGAGSFQAAGSFTASEGLGGAMGVVNPTTYLNTMIKL